MTFRDERESQRARAEALAAELAERERELKAKDLQIEVLKEQLSRPAREGFFAAAVRVARARLGDLWDWLSGHVPIVLGVCVVAGVIVGASVLGSDCASEAPLPPAMSVEVERAATVLETQGRAAFTPGTACSVHVTSEANPEMNCHARISCGGTPLYGEREGSGYLRCTFDATKTPIAGTDLRTSAEDGDPELVLDLAHDRVEVRDGAGRESWSVTLLLGPGSTRRTRLP